jgi:RNA polymerase sigma factor (sigma-70 family)
MKDEAKGDGVGRPAPEIEAAYRAQRQGLLRWIERATHGLADAEDILHDAFANALASPLSSARRPLEVVENLPAWLFAAVRNRVYDLWRRREVRLRAGESEVAEEAIAEIVAATGLDPADMAARDELSDALAQAIALLPPEQRFVIEAQALDGVGFRELSERTGVPIDTLTARKRYAVAKLAKALKGWVVED